MTLLHEIQKDAAASGADLPAILRKCKILAARLGSKEFGQWVAWELNGYPEDQSVPEYRELSAQYYANFMGVGWEARKQPFLWPALGKGSFEKFNPIRFRSGIAKAASLKDGATINRPELALLVQGKMFPEMNCIGAWVEISGSEFEQLMSAISSRVLDFVLEIERANPNAREAPLNTHPVPEEKLQPLVQNFFGAIGNFAQNSYDFTQNAKLGISADDLKKFVGDMSAHLPELGLKKQDQKTVETQLAILKAQLVDKPNPVIVHEAGKTIRNLTEGVIGNFIATASQPSLWGWIQAILEKF
ncbi:MAG: hypothetical protein Q8O42_07165 [Acidobacteriota bacterium]|nr:hypothetical protein [Acidobacteriota bacterium]